MMMVIVRRRSAVFTLLLLLVLCAGCIGKVQVTTKEPAGNVSNAPPVATGNLGSAGAPLNGTLGVPEGVMDAPEVGMGVFIEDDLAAGNASAGENATIAEGVVSGTNETSTQQQQEYNASYFSSPPGVSEGELPEGGIEIPEMTGGEMNEPNVGGMEE